MGHEGALLEVRQVGKSFPGVQALAGVDLAVRAGEVHALVGQNGAGKSTLVRCITGVHAPDAGEIVFAGEPIRSWSPKHAADLGIAVVHQRTRLLPSLSVAENVHLGHLPTRGGLLVDRRAAHRRTRELLARFGLDVDPTAPVSRLSMPERQEVAIARALFRDARMLVLDEPTAALDAEQASRLFALVRNLTREGVAVLYVSHYLEEIFDLADRITVLRDGRLVSTQPTSTLTETEVVTLMAGHRPVVRGAAGAGAGTARDADALLELEAVSTAVLRELTLAVAPGEIVGVTGVVGAGGHELARVLYGLTRPGAGRMCLDGEPYTPRGPRQAIRSGVFLVPEDPAQEGLVPVMSVAGNISLVDLKGIRRGGVLDLRRERRAAEDFRRRLRIATPSVATPVRSLSGGNQQKVLLAKALTAGARLLVLEEPTQGVDVHAKEEIHGIVRSVAEEGTAVIAVSTDIRDLLEFVDRIVAFRRGRVVADVPSGLTSYAEILDLTVGSAEAVAS